MSETNDIESALDAGRQIGAGNVIIVPRSGRAFMFQHKDLELIDLTEHQVPLDYRSNACFDDLQSFIEYVNEYQRPGAHIFARTTPTEIFLRAVLSYTDKDGGNPDGVPVDTRREATLAHFAALESQQLKAWRSKDGVSMSQVEMSECLDARSRDIAEPAAADVLEMIQNFESKRDVHFKSTMRLTDGSISVAFEDKEKSTKSQLEFPSELTLGLPIFRHMEPLAVKAKMRYRVNDGTLRLSYLLQDLEQIFDEQIRAAVDSVRKGTKLPVYLGDLADMPTIFKSLA
jgi:uncharacterized protein YfdQ (DUF2303 family)